MAERGAGARAVLQREHLRCSGLCGDLLVYLDCVEREECAVGAAGGRRTGTLGGHAGISCRAGSAVTTGNRTQ